MDAAVQTPGLMTLAEFLAWDAPPGRRWQLVDGEPRAMAPGNETHGTIQATLIALLWTHLRASRPDCRVVSEPGIVPKVGSDDNYRIPDLLVTCAPNQRGRLIVPDPILLVEILSPSNRAETWTNVWAYTTIPSVREILIVHAEAVRAQLLRRGPDGTWPDTATLIESGLLTLDSIELTVPVTDLYAGTWLLENPSP